MRILLDIPDTLINEELKKGDYNQCNEEYKEIRIKLNYTADKKLHSASVRSQDYYIPCRFYVDGNKHMIIVR